MKPSELLVFPNISKIFQNSFLRISPGLRNTGLEDQLSAALKKILKLSSYTPSSTHNEVLRGLLRNALVTINDFGGNEE